MSYAIALAASSPGSSGLPCIVPAMTRPPSCDATSLQRYFSDRLPAEVVSRRLDMERGHGKPVAGRSAPFAYFERWVLGPRVLRLLLQATGLYRRGQRNALRIEVNRQALCAARLPAALDGTRVLHLSDLHIDSSVRFEQALHDALQGLRFDLAVITGDLRFATHGNGEPALAAMDRLRPLLGDRALLVLGNHDSLSWVPRLEAGGYQVLVNEVAGFERQGKRLWIVGLDDAGYFGTADLPGALEKVPEGACTLVLSHAPEIVHDAALGRCDFVLCGHSHGGQINLPGGIALVTNSRCARRFCRGAWRLGPAQGYTSRGAGTSLLDVRFNCPPEVTLHRLQRVVEEGH